MEKKIKELENHLNFVWSLIKDKPTYGEFNKVFSVDSVDVLRNFEKDQRWLGIARYGTKNEGISIISLFASIVDFLSDGWRLSIIAEGTENTPMEEQIITGFEMIRYDD